MGDEGQKSSDFPLAGDSADPRALGELFDRHRDRLRLMVHLRLDRRLQGRVDASDVLQEAYVEAFERFPDFLQDRPMPFFLWLRFITEQRMQIIHRRHLDTKARDAGREVSLHHQALPAVSSESLGRSIGRPTLIAQPGGNANRDAVAVARGLGNHESD